MFKTVVDGKIRMIPLEAARTQLQKRLSAESTWEQVSSQKKALAAQEAQLRTREAALRAQPVVPQVDEAAFEQEATDLVRSLVSEPEAMAAKKMANMLKKVRLAATPPDRHQRGRPAGCFDSEKGNCCRGHTQGVTTGLSKFQATYPEMTEGSELYLIADRKTNAIVEEHPDGVRNRS